MCIYGIEADTIEAQEMKLLLVVSNEVAQIF
jgi:hypothetical protein